MSDKRIYFIRGVGMRSPIKIGCSECPPRRLRAHEAGSPVQLEIMAEFAGGHDLERRFHAAFRESHERCEWFTWSARLQRTIDQINAGTFDVSGLPPPLHLPRRRGGVTPIPNSSPTPPVSPTRALGSPPSAIFNAPCPTAAQGGGCPETPPPTFATPSGSLDGCEHGSGASRSPLASAPVASGTEGCTAMAGGQRLAAGGSPAPFNAPCPIAAQGGSIPDSSLPPTFRADE